MQLRRLLTPLLSLSALPVLAVYLDEAYSTDFHHALLGIPPHNSTFFQKPQPSLRASLLYTQSHQGILGAVNPKDGTLVWRKRVGGGQQKRPSLLVKAEKDGAVISLYGNGLTCLDAQTGRERWQRYLLHGRIEIDVAHEGAHGLVVVSIRGEEGMVSTTAWDVTNGKEVWQKPGNHVVEIKGGRMEKKLLESTHPSIVSLDYIDDTRFLIRHTADEEIVHERDLEGKIAASFPRMGFQPTSEDSHFIHGTSGLARKSDGSFALRTAMVSENGDWSLFQNGKLVWTRQEGMSGIIAADWIERHKSNALADQIELEVQSNFLSMYLRRTTRHVQELFDMPGWLAKQPGRMIGSLMQGGPADRHRQQTFGFDKLIVLATDRGWMYALDAAKHGVLVWRTKVMELEKDEVWNLKGLLSSQLAGEISLKDSRGRSAVVNSTSGELLRRSKWITRPLAGAIPIRDARNQEYLLPINHGGLPADAQLGALGDQRRTVITQTVDRKVQGVRFERAVDHWKPYPVWTFDARPPARVFSVTSRPKHDPVASLGRTFGDRSVLYKYLNPNLLLITSLLAERQPSTTATATFTLLDSLTGFTVHSFSVPAINTLYPLTSVLSENLLAISYSSSTPSLSGDFLSITELFESSTPNVRSSAESPPSQGSNSSSTSKSLPFGPYAKSLTFLLEEPISNLAVASTRQGITSRSLLATFAISGQLISIPRSIISPFRPVNRDPTPVEQEEGLIRYSLHLAIHPSWIISHRRELVSLNPNTIQEPQILAASPRLLVSDTGLESTALVAVWGTADLFATRIQPSRGFDQLGQGFGKLGLLSTVLLCAAGVLLLGPVVRRKGVLKGWRGS